MFPEPGDPRVTSRMRAARRRAVMALDSLAEPGAARGMRLARPDAQRTRQR
jgi:hypothetical protein